MNFKAYTSDINKAERIVITAHRNPDGDALGSLLAFYHFLGNKGKDPALVLPSEYPEHFSWMPGIDQIVIYDREPDKAVELLKKADFLVCLDFNSPDRIPPIGETILEKEEVPSILIDHHLDPKGFTKYLFSEPQASSTCELVFTLWDITGETNCIDQTVAECLYTGLVTDTGSFRFSTSPRLFKILATLKEIGIRDSMVQNHIFNSNTEKQMRLLGHCLANRMEVVDEYHTGIIYLTANDYKKFKIHRGDTEGIVNYLLMMRHVNLAAFITEQPHTVKLSFRSKGDISVQNIARTYYDGGGHKNAAGGYMNKSLNEVIKHFKSILPEIFSKETVKTA